MSETNKIILCEPHCGTYSYELGLKILTEITENRKKTDRTEIWLTEFSVIFQKPKFSVLKPKPNRKFGAVIGFVKFFRLYNRTETDLDIKDNLVEWILDKP